MLSNKYAESEFLPRKLTEDEIKNPHLIIDQLFDYCSLPVIREKIWDWLKITVSGTFSSEMLTKGERYDLVYLFEHIEKLIEASWLIHSKKKETKKKNK